MQLLESNIFADKVCQLCASDLSMFATLRDDLVIKQKNLYVLAGIEDLNFDKSELVLDETQENSSEFDMRFETVDDDGTSVYVEEHFITEDQELEAAETILEIEKVGETKVEEVSNDKMESDQGDSTVFDYFEEIVENDSNDQYYEASDDKEENTM